MGRPFLLVAIVLMLPLVARAEVRANRGIEACPVVALLAAQSGGNRLRMTCRGCIPKACGADVASCIANCAQTTVVLAFTQLPAPPALSVTPTEFSVLQDHHGPPDPLPPRPIAIG